MWTIQQQKAIHKTNSDLLLTASAGSGKTAVLTERFLELIINGQDLCDIDRILVVTFTRAAVAEMRKRISGRLLKYVEENPGNSHARRQLAMINCASICTIDSFCSSLLKNYFYQADIDPSFEIIDPKEKSLILSKIMDEMLEDFYSGELSVDHSQFLGFVRSYGGKSGDSQISSIIYGLSSFLDTLVDAEQWLKFCNPRQNDYSNLLDFFKSSQTEALTKSVDSLITQLQCGEKLLDLYSTVEHYRKHISYTLEILQDALKKSEVSTGNFLLDVIVNKKSLPILAPLSRKRKGIDPYEKATITYLISQVKNTLNSIPEELLVNQKELIRQLEAAIPHFSIINQIYSEYVSRYKKIKTANNILDYTDLSHKVLGILNDNGIRSTSAIEQQKKYKYILVDEYQDISPLQEELFLAIKRSAPDAGNMFMVGDLKQSIYRFRQADPGIILNKHNSYTPVFDGDQELDQDLDIASRIELNKNFRSRKEILDFVNYIFDRCASASFGGLDYIKDGRMLYGAKNYNDNSNAFAGIYDTPIELHLIDKATDISDDIIELQNPIRREAVTIAHRIMQMVDGETGNAEFDILCPESNNMRPVTYRDIVILLRSPKSQSQIYSEVFAQFGIPLYVQQEGGFFEAIEISDIMSILHIVDNPRQDIPLAAVLRSPYLDCTENELAEIRAIQPGVSLYDAVKNFTQSGQSITLKNKLFDFLNDLDLWRSISRAGTLAALIRKIYAQTELPTYYRGAPDGRQRYANLLFLYDTAREYDTFKTQGLGRFLRFVDDLSNHPTEDFGPARILSENDNVVQLMSIHKSKGLEFPVVILGGLDKKFNLRDLSKPVFFAPVEEGAIAFKLRDPGTGETWKTLPYTILTENERLNCLHEELRVQYVALTRAREHLILFADTNIEKLKEKCAERLTDKEISSLSVISSLNDNVLPDRVLAAANSPLDWYCAALADHLDFFPVSGVVKDKGSIGPKISVQLYDAERLYNAANQLSEYNDLDANYLFNVQDMLIENSNEVYKVCETIDWSYPLQAISTCQARASVTAMNVTVDKDIQNEVDINNKRINDDSIRYFPDSDFSRKPDFLLKSNKKMNAAEIGVLTHNFLELIDITGSLEDEALSIQLHKLVTSGNFTDQQAKYIDIGSVANLFRSETGKLIIKNNKTTYREWEFTLAVKLEEVYPDILDEISSNKEQVIVRGIIDCLVWDGNSYIIIDYKTDDIKPSQLESRADHYRFQLNFYKRAVIEITGKNVSDCYLYFLKSGQSVKV